MKALLPRRHTFILLLTLLILSQCAYFNTYYNAEQKYEEGIKAQERSSNAKTQAGQFNESIRIASRIFEYYPESRWVDDALLLIGKSYYHVQNYHNAIKKFDELISQFPQSELLSEAYLWKAKTLVALNRYEMATTFLALLVKGKVKKKIWVESRFLMAEIQNEQGNLDGAAAAYEEVLKTTRSRDLKADAHFQMGEIRLQQKQYEQAARHYSRVKRFHPGVEMELAASLGRIEAEIQLGNLKKAEDLIRTNLKDEHYYDSWDAFKVTFCRMLAVQGKTDEAMDCYRQHLKQFQRRPSTAEAAFRIGQLYTGMPDQIDSAEVYFQRVKREQSQSTWVDSAATYLDQLSQIKQTRNDIRNLTLQIQLKQRSLNPDSVQSDEMWRRVSEWDQLYVRPDTTREDTLIAKPDTLVAKDSTDAEATTPEAESRLPFLHFDEPTLRGAGETKPEQDPVESAKADSLARLEESRLDTLRFQALMDTAVFDLQIDTVAVEADLDSLFRLREETRLTLGEIYLIILNQPNRADTLLLKLDTLLLQDNQRIQQMYYLAGIYRDRSEDFLADSLLRLIVERYPTTGEAKHIRGLLGMEEVASANDHALDLIERAERSWMDSLNYREAIRLYDKVIEFYPETDTAPLALLAKGWLYRFRLENTRLSNEVFMLLQDKYPESEEAGIVSEWSAQSPAAAQNTDDDKDTDVEVNQDELMVARMDDSGRFIRQDEDTPLDAKLSNFRDHLFSIGQIKVYRILK